MNNYEIAMFDYSKDELKNMFSDSSDVYRPCTNTEMFHISKMLRLPYITRILYFSIEPNRYHPIHIDKTIGSVNTIEFALNIPITDCDEIYMNWFTNLSNTSDIYYPYDKTKATPILDTSKAKTIDTANLNLPMFVKIDNWHNIESRASDVVEKIISIRFYQSITMTDIKRSLRLS